MNRLLMLSVLLSSLPAFAAKYPAVSGKIVNNTKISCWDMDVSISVTCHRGNQYTFGGMGSTNVDGKDCSFTVPAFTYKCGFFEEEQFAASISLGKNPDKTVMHSVSLLWNGTKEQAEKLPGIMKQMVIITDPATKKPLVQ